MTALLQRLLTLTTRARRATATEIGDTLCLFVSERGWHASLSQKDAPAPIVTHGEIGGETPADVIEILRRAVRTVTFAQRERIGAVRVLTDDPAIWLIDNRSLRIKSDDPVMIRQAGAQELGTSGVTYAFTPFGASSESEVERGVYGFLATQRMQDYLGALDTLAVKLVELVPAAFVCLLAAPESAFAMLDVRAFGSTLLLADRATGTVAQRALPVGTRSFAAAVAEATSISVAEAASGLERRACFRPIPTSSDTKGAVTATERALLPILSELHIELQASIEYFVFHRLATSPSRLFLAAEIDRIKGWTEWLAAALELEAERLPSAFERFVQGSLPDGCNLLATVPNGLLKIGKTEFRFETGRFRSEAIPRPAPAPVKLHSAPWRAKIEAASKWKPATVPAAAILVVLFGAAAVTLTLRLGYDELASANDELAANVLEDAVVRSALAKRTISPPAPAVPYWTNKLGALATAMPDGLRLTRLTASADRPTAMRDSKLLVEGETSTGGDHLAKIYRFMEQLKSDPVFASDVSSISFDGFLSEQTAATGSVSASGSVRFSLTVTLKGSDGRGS